MTDASCGKLINKAGKGNYCNPDAPEKLIRYATRTNGMPSGDLVSWGGVGVAEFMGVEGVIRQFYAVQGMHRRKGGFGRYADHEIYSFSREEERCILEGGLDIDRIARRMAGDFYGEDCCQAVYAVHRPDKTGKHMHIHFIVNTVNYRTGGKRRENKSQTRERQGRFQEIVREETGSRL